MIGLCAFLPRLLYHERKEREHREAPWSELCLSPPSKALTATLTQAQERLGQTNTRTDSCGLHHSRQVHPERSPSPSRRVTRPIRPACARARYPRRPLGRRSFSGPHSTHTKTLLGSRRFKRLPPASSIDFSNGPGQKPFHSVSPSSSSLPALSHVFESRGSVVLAPLPDPESLPTCASCWLTSCPHAGHPAEHPTADDNHETPNTASSDESSSYHL